MRVFESSFTDAELSPIIDVIKKGEIGFGPNVSVLETEFKKYSNCRYNIATNSASASAFMIFAYLQEKYGVCDVYTPSLAFASPAWAAKHFRHNLIFVEVNNELLFDCEDYKRKRQETKNKKVVMPILYGGVSTIDDWNLFGDEIVVTDSAHCTTPAIPSDFYFFSFHPYKAICTSDGGMISTSDEEASKYFQSYRNFGRENIDGTYNITQDGFKFYMNNLNATLGLISLKKQDDLKKIRKENYLKFKNILPHDKNSSYYFATRLCNNANDLIKEYNLSRHYPLLHKTKYFQTKSRTRLPRTCQLHSQIINLPLHRTINENLYNS
jgi:dTDP-4-amino-4,6-dideoxygalactose transaminase